MRAPGVWHLAHRTYDDPCTVYGAGLSSEDLDKPQVIHIANHRILIINRFFGTDWDRPGLVGG
jgi:hypothetical protein